MKMIIDSMEAVVHTAYFLIPGYIINSIVNNMVPSKTRLESEKILHCIGYSILELAIWYWLFKFIKKLPDDLYWLILICIIIITSCILGFVIGLLKKKEIIREILKKHNIVFENNYPTAWDFKFSELGNRKLTVALSNGTFIRGVYHNKSCASSDNTYRDIYLENVYMLDNEDRCCQASNADGVWIAPEKIMWISFMEDDE